MEKRVIDIALAGLLHDVGKLAQPQDKSLNELLALASKLSAGEQADQTQNAPKNQPPQQMISIFDRISVSGEPRKEDFHYLPLAPLALDKNVIFAKTAKPKESQTATYEALLEELENAVVQAHDDDETYLENLLAVMQRTTWCAPSTYSQSQLDVSLYDHNRMTAALAVCLEEKTGDEISKLFGAVTRNYQSVPKKDGDDALLEKPVALLVGGDISGVQDFIYTISSKQAAKTLRGRSFYLQLLTEAVLRYVLRELDLPVTNVIYSGGGHFYLLAPFSAKEKLNKIQSAISKKLLKHHGIALYLAMGHTEVPARGFQKGNFPAYWKDMHKDLNRAKRQKYTELKADFHSEVFALEEHGGNQEDTCSVCGRESQDTEPIKDGSEDKRCGLCKSFAEKIGKLLPKSQFVGLGFAAPKQTERKSAFDVLRSFGMLVEWPDDGNQIQFNETVERAVIWSLDDAGKWPVVKDIPTAHITRYTVNLIPMKSSGNPKTFDELQDTAQGIPRLGVLRMDVDDLGDIFSKGLGKRATLARLSALSFQVSLFFEGWLKKICEQEKYKNLIYAVYAGGDDLFIIGPWDKMPGLAQEISTNLAEYTNHHPDFHISGGMAFIGGKYPVYQAADDAEKILDMAKDRYGKNAFGFLEQSWKWDKFTEIANAFETLCTIDELGGPKAIMQFLRELAIKKVDMQRADGRLKYGPWMWWGTYRIYRMEKRAEKKHQDKLAGKLNEIRTSLEKENFENLDQWGTAARWAQLYLRKSDD